MNDRPDDVADAAGTAMDLIQQINDAAKELAGWGLEALVGNGASLDDTLSLQWLLETHTKALGTLASLVETHNAREMRELAAKTWRADVKGLHVYAERHTSQTKTTWDNSALFSRLVQQASTDPDTGEVLEEAHQAVRWFADTVGELAAVNYWRVTALKARGIDPADYRTVTWGRQVVKVTVTEPKTPDDLL